MKPSGRDVEIAGPDGRLGAYLAVPDHPRCVAVVVLQEIFGVNANIRSIVDDFAAAGYATIAPDLFWRVRPGVQLDPESAEDREVAMELMKGLDRGECAADGGAALQALGERVPGLERSAAVGYCFGGGIAYLMASRGLVDLGVSYYGTGIHLMAEEMTTLEGRLLLHIAGDDHLCPPEAQAAIRKAAEGAGDKVSVMTHPGAQHAFARLGGRGYDPERAERANAATLESLAVLARRSPN